MIVLWRSVIMHSVILLLATVSCLVWAQQRPYRPAPNQAPGQVANIISQTNDVGIDGSYRWSFQADNGISAEETGQSKNANSAEPIEEAQGSYQYTDLEGNTIQLKYIANEGGFQPQGAHLPVAPPIPPEILKSLEWNAAHPEEDDGNTVIGNGFRG